MKCDKQVIIDAVSSSLTMAQACAKTGLHWNTFKRYAIHLGVYSPNQSGKGTVKPKECIKSLQDILDGKHPDFQTYKLKLRLYKEGIKENKCECCGIDEWNGKALQCELDHIDGDKTNHKLDNLQILCPNCHSQTDTFRFKRGNNNCEIDGLMMSLGS